MRDRWSSRTVFLLAAIGSAVGLGNIWRFPYITYEYGGGAFLIPYLIALFVIGVPLLMLEFAVGQRFQKGAIAAFKGIHHKLGGVGAIALISGFLIVIYYAAVMAWSLSFLTHSFNFEVPWAGDSESFFFGTVLGISDSIANIGGINLPLLLALFVVWLAIFLIVRKGVHSVGKVVLITVPLPIILLVILFIRGITLPGALEGIIAYIRPDFGAFLDPQIWIAAVSQIFFSFSLGFGVMIAYASFNRKDQDVRGNSYITGLSDAAISIFAGFVVFAVVGYMAFTSGIGIEDAVSSGPGLAFVVFPQALSLMPFAWFFSILFFLTLLTLGIDSAFSLVEAVNTSIGDRYEKPNKSKIAFFVCLISFVLGIIFVTGAGLYFLDVIDHFVTNYGLVLAALFECIAVGWIYGAKNLRNFVNDSCGCRIGSWWDYAIKFVIPIALIILLAISFYTDITTPYEGYPGWALAIGWSAVIIPIFIALFISIKGKKLDL